MAFRHSQPPYGAHRRCQVVFVSANIQRQVRSSVSKRRCAVAEATAHLRMGVLRGDRLLRCLSFVVDSVQRVCSCWRDDSDATTVLVCVCVCVGGLTLERVDTCPSPCRGCKVLSWSHGSAEQKRSGRRDLWRHVRRIVISLPNRCSASESSRPVHVSM